MTITKEQINLWILETGNVTGVRNQVEAIAQLAFDAGKSAVARKDAEIAGWKADQKENLRWQVEQHEQIQALTAERDALAKKVEMLREALEDLREQYSHISDYMDWSMVDAALEATK